MHGLRSRIRHIIAVVAVAGLAAACSGNGSSLGPSPIPGSGLTLSAGSAATATPSAATGHDLPLKGELDGAYTLAFPSPGVLLVTGTGTGNATHFGRFTFAYDEIVDLSTGMGTGTYDLTAANGDTLSADWSGSGFPTPDPTVLLIVENATITGGTGRFANATGSFTVERLFSFITNSGPGSLEGTIQLH
jgi:hypothetical protein